MAKAQPNSCTFQKFKGSQIGLEEGIFFPDVEEGILTIAHKKAERN
jgi:hypothetical protein